jgi:hypothetical protein
MTEVMQIDSFKPDYRRKCVNCEQTPTVTGVKDGKVIYRSEMCGPCTWGEAETLDPSTWDN